jgi:hypothetical protein
MVIIRGTRKVLDRVGSPSEPNTASTTMLGDGFVTVLFWRPQVALFVNATSLLPVFMPMAPAATVLERFPETLAGILRTHGIADHIILTRSARPPSSTSPRPTTAASSAS